MQLVKNAINKCFDYFTNNKGDTKPNAANSDGIPYHVYSDTWQWQISPTSTTSECITLFLRACVACNRLEYAQTLAEYIINNLLFDNNKVPHWLVDIAGGTEMESVKCGNYDNSVYSFNNGVCIIPAGSPHYGEKVSHVRTCFTTDTEFDYKDYWLSQKAGGIEKTVNNYTVNASGCKITLNDTSYNGSLQVYYAYYNNNILFKNELYRTYPRNTRCIVNGTLDYQLSVATDAAQWAATGLKQLGEITLNEDYKTKASEMLETLNIDMQVASGFLSIYDATRRGLFWDSVWMYDESGLRDPYLYNVDDKHTRFEFGGDTQKRSVQWGIGKTFYWNNTSTIDIFVRGSLDFELREIIIESNYKNYYYPWYDKFSTNKEYKITKGEFSSLDNVVVDAARAPYLSMYEWHDPQVYAILSTYDFNDSWKDNNNQYYPMWHKYYWAGIPPEMGNAALVGAGVPGNIESNSFNNLQLILAAEYSGSFVIRVIDANDNYRYFPSTFELQLNSTPQHFVFEWNQCYLYPDQQIAHPIKNIEILVYPDNTAGTLYIGSILIGNRDFFTGNEITNLKFETRQNSGSYFDVSKVVLNEAVEDNYENSGVPVFTLEYTELGLMAWRSGTYTGYTNPHSWLNDADNANVAIQFLKDAQDKYNTDFGEKGPFYPVYLRNLTENLSYGNLETWIWNGPDANTTWAGFQYRALVNVAEYYHDRLTLIDGIKDQTAKTILDNWVNFLTDWLYTHQYLPSTFYSNGTISYEYQAADFNAQVGRAMLLKYLIDQDEKAKLIMNKMLSQLLSMQQTNGAFYPEGSEIYNFHQAETLLFFGQWLNTASNFTDIRLMIMAE